MNASHPELETLAELVERSDETLDPEFAEALAHIEGCPQCREDLEALREVRGALRALPPVSMPDDVAARLEAALRAEAAKPLDNSVGSPAIAVLPLQRAGARTRRFPLSAAASVVVLVVIALGAGITAIAMSVQHNAGRNGTAASGARAQQSPKVLASGNDYRPDAIRSQVAALVVARVAGSANEFKGLTSLATAGGQPMAAASATARPTSSAAAGSDATASSAAASAPAGGYGPAVAARTAPSGPLADPQALQACVETLTGGKAEQPVLVDYALYNGQPATIIVLRDDSTPNTLDVWVEADSGNCVKNGDTAYYGRLSGSS